MSTQSFDFNHPNIELGRRSGHLINEAVIDIDGDTGFDCRCLRCGDGRRRVKRKVFNAKSVVCCEQCAANGGWTDMTNQPPRGQLSLDAEPMALLGFDLALGKPSGVALRALVKEFGELVRTTEVPLTELEWTKLKTVVVGNPSLLTNEGTPRGRLIQIAMVAFDEVGVALADRLNDLQLLAALSALRWVVKHPEQREWWRPSVRTGDDE